MAKKSLAKFEMNDFLEKHRDAAYADFQRLIIPTAKNVVGVRMPQIRAAAKTLLSSPIAAAEFIKRRDFSSHESTLIFGLVLSGLLVDGRDLSEFRDEIAHYVEQIDNWGVCDSFCIALKIAGRNPAEMLDFIRPYLRSSRAYDLRFALVMLLYYYLTPTYLDFTVTEFVRVRHSDRAVKFAAAWGLATAAAIIPDRIIAILRNEGGENIDGETAKIAIQKIIDSRRISDEHKEQARKCRDNFRKPTVKSHREKTKLVEASLREYVEMLGSNAEVPGGGSAAALVGAVGAACAQMAANFSLDEKKFGEKAARAKEIIAQLQKHRAALENGIDADAEAFGQMSAVYALPKNTESEKEIRRERLQAALENALLPPLTVMRESAAALKLLPELAEIGNKNLLTDTGCAAILLAAANAAARLNVLINAKFLQDESYREKIVAETKTCRATAEKAAATVAKIVADALGDFAKI